jgi:hypothetical protein
VNDPFADPQWKAYAAHAAEYLVPMIADSAVTISMAPTGESDIKFALELGLSIMMDKPIITVIEPGTAVPARLVRVSDAIVEGCLDDPELMHRRLKQAIDTVLAQDPG